MKEYQEKKFNLPEISGLSKKQIDAHLALYAGYVKNINALRAKIAEYKGNSEAHALALSELVRRLAFEWDGMRMHEYYFEALGGNGTPEGTIVEEITRQFGAYDTWLSEFKAVGMMRGTGWVTLTKDERTGELLNTWVSDHEIGHLAGCSVLIAMDVWEHAYILDYLPSERKTYIDVFIKNLAWNEVEKRFRGE
jgi:Fe-Mn family superoxide dismutase